MSKIEKMFREDCMSKSAAAKGSKAKCRHKVSRIGADGYTEKQLKARNSACVSYKIGEVVSHDTWMSYPEDIREIYTHKHGEVWL